MRVLIKNDLWRVENLFRHTDYCDKEKCEICDMSFNDSFVSVAVLREVLQELYENPKIGVYAHKQIKKAFGVLE